MPQVFSFIFVIEHLSAETKQSASLLHWAKQILSRVQDLKSRMSNTSGGSQIDPTSGALQKSLTFQSAAKAALALFAQSQQHGCCSIGLQGCSTAVRWQQKGSRLSDGNGLDVRFDVPAAKTWWYGPWNIALNWSLIGCHCLEGQSQRRSCNIFKMMLDPLSFLFCWLCLELSEEAPQISATHPMQSAMAKASVSMPTLDSPIYLTKLVMKNVSSPHLENSYFSRARLTANCRSPSCPGVVLDGGSSAVDVESDLGVAKMTWKANDQMWTVGKHNSISILNRLQYQYVSTISNICETCKLGRLRIKITEPSVRIHSVANICIRQMASWFGGRASQTAKVMLQVNILSVLLFGVQFCSLSIHHNLVDLLVAFRFATLLITELCRISPPVCPQTRSSNTTAAQWSTLWPGEVTGPKLVATCTI